MSEDTMKNFNPFKIEEMQLNRFTRSYKCSDIYKWVTSHLDDENIDIAIMARSIYQNYFDYKNHSKPNSRAFYYIEINREGSVVLKRDTILSPVIKPDSHISISIKDLQKIKDKIEQYKFSIKFNPNLIEYDQKEYDKSHDLFRYRLSLILDPDEKYYKIFGTYGLYKKLQIYNIFEDYMKDLSMLSENIF